MAKLNKANFGYFIALIALIADQASKLLVLKTLGADSPSKIEVLPVFNIVSVLNKGISFGIFSKIEYSNFIFSCVALIIIYYITKLLNNSKTSYQATMFGLVIGGAVGNIIDRFRHDGVVDFLDFFYKDYHFPSFNIADTTIFLGLLLYGIEDFLPDSLKPKREEDFEEEQIDLDEDNDEQDIQKL